MTKQPDALRLADSIENASHKLRRLHEANVKLHEVNVELLAALSRLMNGTTTMQDAFDASQQARTAIAKATGETE